MTTTAQAPASQQLTHSERMQDHAEAAARVADLAHDAAAQAADTFLQSRGRGFRPCTDAALFDAAQTLRAAAARLEAVRAEWRATQQ